MQWRNQAIADPEANLAYFHELTYTVYQKATPYKVVYWPRAVGDTLGYVANVYDRHGRLLGGTDMGAPTEVVSSLREARALVAQVVGDATEQ